jgi:hypothetical protein
VAADKLLLVIEWNTGHKIGKSTGSNELYCTGLTVSIADMGERVNHIILWTAQGA